MQSTQSARIAMVESQLLTGHVLNERILQAIASVPRELFVPEPYRGAAYVDDEVEVAPGRYQLEPLAFARMLTLAQADPQDNTLAIGCLNGYCAGVLAQLSANVTGLEEQAELTARGMELLAQLFIRNARLVSGPHAQGYKAAAPYSLIVIYGGVQHIEQSILNQLAEGGRLVAIKNISRRPGSEKGLGKSLLAWKADGQIFQREGDFDASVPVVPGFEAKPQFTF